MNANTTLVETQQNALFPIGTVSEQTGVNTVTLRAWERRYGLLKPHRTPKGHRLYSPHDIERVKKVLILLEQGIPVSRVRDVLDHPSSPVLHLVPDLSTDDPWQHYRNQCLRCIHKLDTAALERIFNEADALYSFDLLAKKLLQPLYQELVQQRCLLPATTAEFAFFHAFLCARLGSRYLHHNSHANGKRLLLVNTQALEKQVESLLLANSLSQRGYITSLLDTYIQLDHLPLVLERNTFDALVLIGAGQMGQPLEALARLYALPIFVSATVSDLLPQSSLQVLPETLTEITAMVDQVLKTPHP